MKVVYDPAFYAKLKKVDVRIKKIVKQKILLFSKNPKDPQLNNHPLKKEYLGYNSIDITANYQALYKIVKAEDEIFAYFVLLGTHVELYL